MDVFVARQPIFDRAQRVQAYELLYRSSRENVFSGTDDTTTTARVLSDTALSDRVDSLTGGKPMFVNFGRELLLGGHATLVPPDRLVVEVLETVEPDADVLAACTGLKQAGYRIALDDYASEEDDNPLLDIADIVKVDFRLAGPLQRKAIARRLGSRGIELLAEKVETRADFEQAASLGYALFQGYFFAQPAVVAGKALNSTRHGQAAVLAAVQDPDMDFAAVERALKQDGALTDKLLRYINSAAFGWRSRIDSLRHALVLLGESQVRKWVSVVALSEIASGKPDELMTSALLRAHMCESLAAHAGGSVSQLQAFLVGLYSLLDALLDTPLNEAVANVPLDAVGKAALLGEHNELRRLLDAVVAYERGDWSRAEAEAASVSLTLGRLADSYLPAAEVASDLRAA